jgi:antitoxin component YwqK of YwqJK toxin-antitoxin module
MALRCLLTAALALALLGAPIPALCVQEGVGYYPNGRVQWEYLYQQGEVREARWYDEFGKLSARTLYTGGQATASEGYRSDGTLAWRSQLLPDGHQETTRFDPQRRPETRYLLKGNQPDGVSITYYPNGRMRQTVLFRNGVLQGPAQAFAEDGHLESEYAYKDGLLDGVLRSYAADGRLLVEQKYLAGELQE